MEETRWRYRSTPLEIIGSRHNCRVEIRGTVLVAGLTHHGADRFAFWCMVHSHWGPKGYTINREVMRGICRAMLPGKQTAFDGPLPAREVA